MNLFSNKILRKILRNGIREDLSDVDKKIVRVTNFAEILGILTFLTLSIIYFFNNNISALYLSVFAFVAFVVSFLLNGKGYFQISKIIMMSSAIITITGINLSAGHANGIHFFNFAIIAGSFVVFSRKKMTITLTFCSLALLSFYIIIFLPFLLDDSFSDNQILSEFLGYTISVVCVVAMLYYFMKLSHDLENKLVKANNALDRESKTKNKFISILAHDLRNPIGGLKSMLDLINAEIEIFEEGELSEALKEMSNTTNNVYQLLEELLTWSISRSGHIELSPNVMNLSHLIEPTATLYEVSFAKKNIYFDIVLHKNSQVYCDQNTISTVIRNLLSNAIKFTPEGGQILIESKDSDDDMILISITDSGVGMSEGVFSQLFNIDQNISTPGTNGEKGTGLGLSICKEFVELNGGEIWTESEVGKGSRFFFTVPKST